MKDKLIIIGAGGHGKVVADIAKLNDYQEIMFLDDNENIKRNGIYDVIGTTKDIDKYVEDYDFFIAVGDNTIKKNIADMLSKKDISLPILIHPSAIVDHTSTIGDGTVIMANAVINADTKIGKNCIINTASTVDHDNIIEDYVHISPGAHLSGTVHIGKETWVGTGANIINNISITNQCMIGAGSVIVKDIEESGTYVGIPTRKIS